MELDDSVGYRFHPTEQEIISYFLARKMCNPAWISRTILEVKNICKFEPWSLPEHSPLPSNDQVWYFFNVPVSMSPNSTRIDRTTNIGFWKLTGKDRPIRDKQGKKEIGYKRNLVFHRGRSPNGVRMNWVMHEYHSNKVSPDKEEYVVFRLKRKVGDSSDIYDEPSDHLASDSRNHVAASQEQQGTSCWNGLDRNSLSALFSLVQSEQGTSYSNGKDRNPLSELSSSIQKLGQRTSHSNGEVRNPRSTLFSSIQQSDQRTSCSNGTDRNSLSALFLSTQSEPRPSNWNGADGNPLSELFSSIHQSEQRTSYSNGADRNPLSELFSTIQHSGQRTSNSNGGDFNPLFSTIQQSEQRNSYSNGADCNPLSEMFSTIQQSEQRTAYANGADRNPLSKLFSLIHQSEQQTSISNGADHNAVSELFSLIQQSEQQTSYSNDVDRNPVSELFSSIQQDQGTSISIGFNDEWNLSNSPFNTNEREDAFMYLSDQDEYNGEIHTVIRDANPPKSMRGMYAGDSSDTYADIVVTESGSAFEIPILLNGNASSEVYSQVPMVRAPNGTSCSSICGRRRGDNGIYQGVDMQFELQSDNSDTEMFEINYCLDELQMAEFPPSPRTCKAQHMPKSHRVIQEKCATERFQLRRMVSSKQVSNEETREATTSVIDLARKENNTDKFDKEQKIAHSTNAKTSSKIKSNESEGSNNRNASTHPLGHKTIPPFVYIGNMLVSFVLILFFIREMCLFTE